MSDLQTRFLFSSEGEPIPVRMTVREGNTLLECAEPGRFLRHLAAGRPSLRLHPDAYLRGVVFRDNGAVFQVFDPIGPATDEIRLDSAEANRLLQEIG